MSNQNRGPQDEPQKFVVKQDEKQLTPSQKVKAARNELQQETSSPGAAFKILRKNYKKAYKVLEMEALKPSTTLDEEFVNRVFLHGDFSDKLEKDGLRGVFTAAERKKSNVWTADRVNQIVVRGAKMNATQRNQFNHFHTYLYDEIEQTNIKNFFKIIGVDKVNPEEVTPVQLEEFKQMYNKALKIESLKNRLSTVQEMIGLKNDLITQNEITKSDTSPDTKEGREIIQQCDEETAKATETLKELKANKKELEKALAKLQGIEVNETTEAEATEAEATEAEAEQEETF